MTELRVTAVNTAADSENKIHDDSVAARFGFRGGLVPGVTVYGYMAEAVIAHFGPDWLERGEASVRFLQPFYEGEEVISRFDGLKLSAANPEGVECAAGTASLPSEVRPVPVELPATPMAAERRKANRETLAPGVMLGTLVSAAGSGTGPYPLLALANEVFVRNYELGPWIHTSSDVRNYRAVRQGEPLEVRARVLENFERKGHELVTLDVQLLASGQMAQSVRHTAIYKLRGA